MPIIEFSQQDILRGTILDPAWYTVKIEATGEKLSAKGDSTNYVMEGIVLRNGDNGDEGDLLKKPIAGVPLTWNFNSKAIGFMVGYFEALGHEVREGKRFDLDNTVGELIDVFVENDTWEGRPVNRVNHKYRAPREEAA